MPFSQWQVTKRLSPDELAASAERLSHRKQYGASSRPATAGPRSEGSEVVYDAPERPSTGMMYYRDNAYYLRVGTQWVKQNRLSKEAMQGMMERLCTTKTRTDGVKPTAVQLKYEFDQALRGGVGGYHERLVPVKHVTPEEKTQYMVTLAGRCAETRKHTHAKLAERYLQPLATKIKKLSPEEMEEHNKKIERLYQGLGVLDR
ncbi:hypothetical protein WJX72_012325 [[Myrmecia] bisecta]|uniref:Uncharacterized protein n=1 Tax=[Myrmecia] bisecta TaxID=41462 RepID=A0AAW1P644_9CHLO